MNYINRPKSAYTQEERIKYLEESIRELRKEKENLKKEKGELKAWLEEENKKLKEDFDNYKKKVSEDMKGIVKDQTENIKIFDIMKGEYKKLEEENRKHQAEDIIIMEYRKAIQELEEEIKNLKLTLEQMENTCKDYLNDRDTLREENEKLKEEIRFLEQCLDNKEKVNKQLREEIGKLVMKS